MTLARRISLALLATVVVAAAGLAPVTASGATARASLPAIERQVMCAACGVPLNIAESPQADRERAFIQSLIDQGQTTAQIRQALVAQYGPAVLATPAKHGFGLVAYLVPVAVAAMLIALLALLLPRWRRRAGKGAPPSPPPAALSPADAARLESDLARFDG